MTALDAALIDAYTGGVNAPVASQDGYITIARVTDARVNWDYLASDDVNFGDQGVPVGRYMSAAGGLIKTAIQLALAANPSKVLFLLPPGSWLMTAITEAAGGLRNNLVFDGIDRDRCELYSTSTGQKFQWVNEAPSNIAFRNITFRLTDPAGFYAASINISTATNVLVERCRFVCTFPSAVANGIRHACFLLGGTNITARHNIFDGTQLQMCGLGRSGRGIKAYENDFFNTNDLGISVNSGDGSGLTLRDVHIHHNRFRDCYGAGYIYVGSDAVTTDPDLMSDVIVENNICSGDLLTQIVDGGRNGIIVAWCVDNKRVHIRQNQLSNDNPAFTTADNPSVNGIFAFQRNTNMVSATDVSFNENSVEFVGVEEREGLHVSGFGINALQVRGNTIHSGGRGMQIANCSNADISHNTVLDSTTAALTLLASDQDMVDLRIRHNYFKTTTAFKASIQVSGDNDVQMDVEQNRLVTSENSIINSLTGGATLAVDYNYNKHSVGLAGSVTPDQNTGNQVL